MISDALLKAVLKEASRIKRDGLPPGLETHSMARTMAEMIEELAEEVLAWRWACGGPAGNPFDPKAGRTPL